MATAAAHPGLVSAVALLNGAGPFDEPGKAADAEEAPATPAPWQEALAAITMALRRVVLFFAFQRAKQPGTIKQVRGGFWF